MFLIVPIDIPTLGEWGLGLMALLMAVMALKTLRPEGLG
jgi:hypothetical protein